MIASPIAPPPAASAMHDPALLHLPKRIALLNVKYSPNLGDGLLSECLERELSRSLPGCEVVSVDLAGRRAYPDGSGHARTVSMAALEKLPRPLRQVAARAALAMLLALRLRPHYRQALADAEAVVLGGGNLLTDADLNFPMKISGALAETARRGLPLAVYAVGVSPRWSRPGHRLFTDAFRRSHLIWASVRDRQSQDAWAGHRLEAGAGIPRLTPQLVVDPGILASLHYPPALPRQGEREARRVGLCITDPMAVRYHGGGGSATDLDAWYGQALRSLARHGFETVLFTNGSPEDRAYLQQRSQVWLRHAGGPVGLQPRFGTPADLARFVSGCDAVVGHRMHACIAAHSFGVPAIGLRWDVKLDSFFALTERTRYMLDPAEANADDLGLHTEAAIADRFDPAPLIARACREIADFAAHLQTCLARAA